PNSPLFPALQLTLAGSTGTGTAGDVETYIPTLPDKPLTQTSSMQVYIIPAEKTLFVQGFTANEFAERPPTLLRGTLYVRVLKPSKVKSITLTFKGQQRTEWPEGIPPKRTTFSEINDIVSHTWPFFQQGQFSGPNNGADVYREPDGSTTAGYNADHDISQLNLADTFSRSSSPSMDPQAGNFFTRNLSPSFVRRAASPAPEAGSIFNELSTTASASESDPKTGHFAPGDYIYNFEHPLPPSTPETCSVTFGSVEYHFEATVTRAGTFKSNLNARLPIEIVRTPAEFNLEENEPIVISRDWEDQLRYDIVVGGKSVILNSYLPLAFRFVPLWGKVALHRIRVYLTENLEYYCQNKKVHRMEPPKKYLLLEHKAKKGKSLLSAGGGNDDSESPDVDDEVLPKELEFQLYVPRVLNEKFTHEIHPDTSLDTIQAHHWIKICLRISRKDPEKPEKRKHYEISIDSPIHILSPLAAHGNTLLPAYDNGSAPSNISLPNYSENSPPLSPEVQPIDGTHPPNPLLPGVNRSDTTLSLDAMIQPTFYHLNSALNNDDPIERDGKMHLEANLYKPKKIPTPLQSPQATPHPGTFLSPLNSPIQRPIHLLRKPSVNPPPFNPDLDPSTAINIAPPPAYEEEDSLSLSPLRISVTAPGRASPPVVNNINVIPASPLQETPVKDMLSKQLNARPAEDLSPREPKRSLEQALLDLDKDSTEEDQANRLEVPDERASIDITDTPGSPLVPPESIGSGLNSAAMSRRSSITSLNSLTSDLPVDQTIPLLALHASSATIDDLAYRNGSVNSLMYDYSSRRPSHPHIAGSNMLDLVDGKNLTDGIFEIHENLLGLRNPRIKRHYQD
ncbi:uncharacterized protein CANTADRAFT_40948, partial [Suhomyces tanzawaensis NRRL Y-17324]